LFDGHTKPSVCDFLVKNMHKYLLPPFECDCDLKQNIKEGKIDYNFVEKIKPLKRWIM